MQSGVGQHGDVADEIGSPVAAADDGDVDRFGQDCSLKRDGWLFNRLPGVGEDNLLAWHSGLYERIYQRFVIHVVLDDDFFTHNTNNQSCINYALIWQIAY